ncbi:hypothetical protein DDI_1646 [Dickeya dianthicola RNS04.9]|nr:hypothetical protein DDI_1646 [Dickeya dianthicola RNS04.9]
MIFSVIIRTRNTNAITDIFPIMFVEPGLSCHDPKRVGNGESAV